MTEPAKLKRKLAFHPEFWAQLAEAPPDVREIVHKVIDGMQQAIDNLPADATEEQINAEIERLTGGRIERIEGTDGDEIEIPRVH